MVDNMEGNEKMTVETESPNLTKAKELLILAEEATDPQETSKYQQLANSWLQIEQMERYPGR